jgi:hypothetical protein
MKTPLYRQKSFWAGLGAIVTGAGMCAMGNVPEGLQTIFGGFAVIFIRQAVEKNGPVE